MLEAANIVNNTPLTEITPDPNVPFPLTPACLLTQKRDSDVPPLESFDEKDLLAYGTRRRRYVQALAEQFWSRWRTEYLQSLQSRRKWKTEQRSLKSGDLVLLSEITDLTM